MDEPYSRSESSAGFRQVNPNGEGTRQVGNFRTRGPALRIAPINRLLKIGIDSLSWQDRQISSV